MTVPAGGTAVSFTATTVPVDANVGVPVKATLGANSITATLTVQAPALTSLTISPSTVTGGQSTTGIVRLTGNAGPSGVTVTLSGGGSGVGFPATVTIAAGTSAVSFPITTVAVGSTTTVTISAKVGAVTKSANLTIN